jgi:hypothetical protein
MHIKIFDIDSINKNLALRRVVEALDEIDDSGLSATRTANDCNIGFRF